MEEGGSEDDECKWDGSDQNLAKTDLTDDR